MMVVRLTQSAALRTISTQIKKLDRFKQGRTHDEAQPLL